MDECLTRRAVDALQAYQATLQAKGKPKLLDEDPVVSLIIALKKIPNRTIRPHRIPLTHTLYPLESTEMCLVTKQDKSTVKSQLEEKKIQGVSKVIPIAKLKTNYKSYELKRRLSSSYDVFLTDKRLYHMLPRLLGKKFFEKKKYPFPVDMQKKDLAQEISRARDATYLHIGIGSCCCVPVGRVGFPAEHLVENITMAMRGVASKVPRGLSNIQSVHLKSVDSIALPIYTSLPPEPSSLPAIGDVPSAKRIRLSQKDDTPEGKVDHEVIEDGEEVEEARKETDLSTVSTPKLSAKKIRGSTVISSRSEKAMRSRVVGRIVHDSKSEKIGRTRRRRTLI